MSWIESFIRKTYDPYYIQEPELPVDAMLHILKLEEQNGLLSFVANQREKILFIIKRYSRFTVTVDLFSENGNGFEVLKESRKVVDWIWDNTDFHRIEIRTRHTGVVALVKKCGFSRVGVHKESFRTKEGTWADEYVYGLNRPE